MFPVRYELNSYILLRWTRSFKRLCEMDSKFQKVVRSLFSGTQSQYTEELHIVTYMHVASHSRCRNDVTTFNFTNTLKGCNLYRSQATPRRAAHL
jgi:hypothetical protein